MRLLPIPMKREKPMLKRLFTTITLSAAILQGPVAQAADLDSAFGSLMTYDTPGVYSTSTRTAIVAGGMDVRFPRSISNLSLVSITPPTMPSAGCNGISAHFGGFSFVSGQQIEQLIKSIGQNAVGMVVSVVIKTLCPICDAVIQAMTKLAQDAARLSINSCQIGTSIANNLMGSTGRAGDTSVKNMCTSNMTSGDGITGDSLEALQGINGACSSIQNATKNIREWLYPKNADGTPGEKPNSVDAAQAQIENMVGNLTWNELNGVFGEIDGNTSDDDIRNRLLLLNVLGTEIKSDVDAEGKPEYPSYTLNAMISPKHLFDLFMCGAPKAYSAVDGGVGPAPNSVADDRVTREYCSIFYAAPTAANKNLGQSGGYEYNVFICDKNDLKDCLHPKSVPLRDADILRGLGFLPQTEKILVDAVNAVRMNKGPFDQKFMSLVNKVNFPIYQAVNAAAVYPASANDLVTTMSVLVAESLVAAQLEEILKPQGRNPNKAKISQATANRIYAVFENLQKTHAAQRESFGRMMAVQEGAVHAIRQVNLAIQKQVLTPQLMGNQKYGEAVAGSVTPTTP